MRGSARHTRMRRESGRELAQGNVGRLEGRRIEMREAEVGAESEPHTFRAGGCSLALQASSRSCVFEMTRGFTCANQKSAVRRRHAS